MKNRKLNPGSIKAREYGCTCPVLDNSHGKGYLGGVLDKDGNTVFVCNMECPVHGEHATTILEDI